MKQTRAGCVKLCPHYFIGGQCANGGGECLGRPSYALSWDLDDTQRGFCNAPAKAKSLKCNAIEKKAVAPGQAQKPGRKD